MKLTRREFAKLGSLGIAIAVLPFSLIGCGVDAIIAGLDVALSVLSAAAGIAGLNPLITIALQKVSAIVGDIVTAYQQYEKTASGQKPGFLPTLEGIITAAQAELSKVLNDVGIKSPGLVKIITTAVAIVNSAIMALVNKLGSATKAKVAAAHGSAKPLPTISNAKSANDLKKAWNDAVKAEHPEAVIR